MANLFRYFIAPLLLAGLVLAVGYCRGNAAPPPGPIDEGLEQWFLSLVRPFPGPPYSPVQGSSQTTHLERCCGSADCRPEPIRVSGDTIYVHQSDDMKSPWVPVTDPEAIVWREDNPLGLAIVCRYPTKTNVRCVVPWSGG